MQSYKKGLFHRLCIPRNSENQKYLPFLIFSLVRLQKSFVIQSFSFSQSKIRAFVEVHEQFLIIFQERNRDRTILFDDS